MPLQVAHTLRVLKVKCRCTHRHTPARWTAQHAVCQMSWKRFDVFQSILQLWIKVSGQEIRQTEAHLRIQSHQQVSRRCARQTPGVQRGKAGGRFQCKAMHFANALQYAQTRGVLSRTLQLKNRILCKGSTRKFVR